MEGLKLIAQATFDRHQKFRPGAGPGAPPDEGDAGPYRYNVIEIGAFAGTAPSSRPTNSATGASNSSSKPNGGGSAGGSPSRVTLNEWMVFEDDLGAFMKKRPVYVASSPPPAEQQPQPQQNAPRRGGSAATGSTGLSRSASSKISGTGTSTTAATTATGTSGGSGGARRANGKEEIEAVASLKLVCIQRAAADLDGGTGSVHGTDNNNTLAISREVFLRLYVELMDADHSALYYLAREYDGFHEFNDSSRGVATKFLGTSDYALIWTFNRRTLETRGVFIDRCQRWQAKDAGPAPPSAPAAADHPGSAPATPVTPSRKWTQNRSGTVTASEAWQVFRETLHTYRTYVFAPQLLSFVGCVHMLRAFDDQVSGDDLPLLKDAEASVAAAHEEAMLRAGSSSGADYDDDEARRAVVASDSLLPTTQTSSFVIAPEQNPIAPSTPPSEAEKMYHHQHHYYNQHQQNHRQQQQRSASARRADAERHKLLSHALACSRVDGSLSNKLRHLKTTRTVLEALAREHETVVADVVAPEFLDRYHRSMEGMTEAVPALEGHVASLEEYLRYLKGRSERLSGTALPLVRQYHCQTLLESLQVRAAGSRSAPVVVAAAAAAAACPPSSPGVNHQSDLLSLRCHEADSRPGRVVFGRPVARPGGGGGGGAVGLGISVAPGVGAAGEEPVRRGRGRDKRGEADGRGRNLGFYAGYLLRGNYSHRIR